MTLSESAVRTTDHAGLVRSVLADHGRLMTAVTELTDWTNLYELGLTSHACVNVMLAIEDALGLEVPEAFLKRATFETIANLTAAVDDAVAAG